MSKNIMCFVLFFCGIYSLSAQYYLPYAANNSYTCTQGNNDTPSHSGIAAFALDFNLDRADQVCAMRGGEVTSVVEHFQNDNCGQQACAGNVNRVVIKHPDGTRSTYMHHSPNSAMVEEGDFVLPGQPISNAGCSGWCTGDHVHVQVSNTGCDACYWTQSMAFSFEDVATNNGVPTTNNVYRSGNTFFDLRLYSAIRVNPSPMQRYQSVSGQVLFANYSRQTWSGRIFADLFSDNDTYLGTIDQKIVNLNGRTAQSWNFSKDRLQSPPGNYKIYIRVQRANEQDINFLPRGNFANPVNVRIEEPVNALPDFHLQQMSVSSRTPGPGELIQVESRIENAGQAIAPGHRLYYLLYQSGSNYHIWGYSNIPSLAVGASYTRRVNLRIPANGFSGSCRLYVYSDLNRAVEEVLENNNGRYVYVNIDQSSNAVQQSTLAKKQGAGPPAHSMRQDIAAEQAFALPLASEAEDQELSSSDSDQVNLSCFPNPLKGRKLTIRYHLARSAMINVALLNVKGQIVYPVFDGKQVAGQQAFTLDNVTLLPGLYYCRLHLEGVTYTKKLMITR